MVSVPLSPFISEGQMDVAFVMGKGRKNDAEKGKRKRETLIYPSLHVNRRAGLAFACRCAGHFSLAILHVIFSCPPFKGEGNGNGEWI